MTVSGEAPILIRRSCERLAVLRTLAQRAISDMARSLSKTDVEAQLAASLALSVWQWYMMALRVHARPDAGGHRC
jgi:hypothetical protein